MTPEEWQRVRPILESALELDPLSRPAFLDEACSDPSLRIEVESLILSHEQAGTNVLNPGSVLGLNPDEETRFRLPPNRSRPLSILSSSFSNRASPAKQPSPSCGRRISASSTMGG